MRPCRAVGAGGVLECLGLIRWSCREGHEAFSAQALGVIRELPNRLGSFMITDETLTPDSGTMAIAQPLGGHRHPICRRSPIQRNDRNTQLYSAAHAGPLHSGRRPSSCPPLAEPPERRTASTMGLS